VPLITSESEALNIYQLTSVRCCERTQTHRELCSYFIDTALTTNNYAVTK